MELLLGLEVGQKAEVPRIYASQIHTRCGVTLLGQRLFERLESMRFSSVRPSIMTTSG